MSELEEQISSILNDPAQMDRITRMARSLMGGGAEDAGAAPESPLPELGDPALLGRLSGLLRQARAGDSRQEALLAAMEPYLSPGRREKLDRAVKLARMARLAQLAMAEGGAEHG